MNKPISSDKKSYPISTIFFIVFSTLSLIVAITSVVYTTKTNLDRDRISSIDSINDDILHLITMLIQNPYLQHLAASPEDYPRVFELVTKSLDKTSKPRLTELLLTEETMAILFVNLYERIINELDYAMSRKYRYRINYLRYHLNNFEHDLLLNPRLHYLFQNSLEHVSTKVRDYYSHKVDGFGLTAKDLDDTGPILKLLNRKRLLENK